MKISKFGTAPQYRDTHQSIGEVMLEAGTESERFWGDGVILVEGAHVGSEYIMYLVMVPKQQNNATDKGV